MTTADILIPSIATYSVGSKITIGIPDDLIYTRTFKLWKQTNAIYCDDRIDMPVIGLWSAEVT